MKKALSFLMFLITIASFAQTDLYVSNNANTYIYVAGSNFNDTPVSATVPSSNVPLFVTNNIELAGSNSFIYLRNDGQLLQSSSSNGNSGTGNLSVYQEGNVSAYEYNYWCSPVGSTTASSVSNPFGVTLLNDVVNVTNSTPATVVHLPDHNGLASPLTIERNWIYKYTNPSNLYSDWVPVFANTTINPGEGFTMKGTNGTSANNPGNAQRYDFRGKPNSGTFTMNVAAPVAGVAQQTLVGNPYPSSLDARSFLYDTQNVTSIDAALYYWEQASIGSHYLADYQGGYGTYTINAAGTVDSYSPAVFLSYDAAGNPTGSVGGSVPKTARRFIPVGQGFMVQGRVGSTGTVRTTNNMRVFYKESSANSEFFRLSSEDETYGISYNEYGFSMVPADYKRFRLNVEFNNLYKRQLVQNFHATAGDGFDVGLEAKSPEGVDSDAYWTLDNEAYVIQANNFDASLRIPLVVNVAEQQPVGFSIFDIQQFDDSQPIYIHDIDANLYVDLRTQNYEINLPVGNYTNRFEITFEDATLNTPEVTEADFKIFQDNPQAQLTVLNPNGLDVKSVKMFDTAGKQIFNATNLNIESEYHFTTKTLSEGVYVASITVGSGDVITKKVIVKN
ncbi:T9SS type A sorting domain-containing protein [Subsaxibacter sp. CAU 1640]|uniref:T9SS type A sorting domain-containing protein n=1 Tax=Subsaxibacter sp. CAU 1640 TaxID=2933271 RepID=UPI0020037D5A|nr:T9SS type A sorting domain-containing protein [Subsaxibacter sp. CAU 1640]MCK7590448.1 T9SS type A sorting domain-containing protein [Subsaxibacter sp. CAU 1640]